MGETFVWPDLGARPAVNEAPEAVRRQAEEAGRAEGYARGLEEGRAAARSELESLRNELTRALDDVDGRLKALFDQRAEQLAELVRALCHKVLGWELTTIHELLEEIVAETVERIDAEPGIYLLGPGSSLAAVKSALGMTPTLIGVDVLDGNRQVGRDVDAAWLEDYLARTDRPVTLVMSFTRGQGFLLGRGNQQLTPGVLRRVGRNRLWVLGTRTKLLTLEGRPLLVDTDDPALDEELAGLVEVITGYQDSLYYRVDNGG